MVQNSSDRKQGYPVYVQLCSSSFAPLCFAKDSLLLWAGWCYFKQNISRRPGGIPCTVVF